MAFAVGDGNHSLATAKAHWDRVKETLTEEERKTHPARFALAEFNNIYDEGIYFEPIYRLVNGVDRVKFIKELKAAAAGHFIITDGEEKTEVKGNAALPAVISAIDGFIKEYIATYGGAVDYIHGEENLIKLVKADKTAVGVMPDALNKSDLFRYVSKSGSLPRKTFSMGMGVEKRYYLEGKKIR